MSTTIQAILEGATAEVTPPRMEYRQWKVGVGDGGFVSVSPFTAHEFLLPAELIAGSDARPLGLKIIIEAKNWLGELELLQEMTSGEWAIQSLEIAMKSFRAGKDLDNLNSARVMFRLPPIKP